MLSRALVVSKPACPARVTFSRNRRRRGGANSNTMILVLTTVTSEQSCRQAYQALRAHFATVTSEHELHTARRRAAGKSLSGRAAGVGGTGALAWRVFWRRESSRRAAGAPDPRRTGFKHTRCVRAICGQSRLFAPRAKRWACAAAEGGGAKGERPPHPPCVDSSQSQRLGATISQPRYLWWHLCGWIERIPGGTRQK